MKQARLRIKINSLSLSKFNPTPVKTYWIVKDHQFAETVSKNKLVIDRIKKEEVENDCKIFDSNKNKTQHTFSLTIYFNYICCLICKLNITLLHANNF